MLMFSPCFSSQINSTIPSAKYTIFFSINIITCYNNIPANTNDDFTNILTSVDIKSERPDCYSNHALRMVEELDGFSVQREVILVLNDNENKYTVCDLKHCSTNITYNVLQATTERPI